MFSCSLTSLVVAVPMSAPPMPKLEDEPVVSSSGALPTDGLDDEQRSSLRSEAEAAQRFWQSSHRSHLSALLCLERIRQLLPSTLTSHEKGSHIQQWLQQSRAPASFGRDYSRTRYLYQLQPDMVWWTRRIETKERAASMQSEAPAAQASFYMKNLRHLHQHVDRLGLKKMKATDRHRRYELFCLSGRKLPDAVREYQAAFPDDRMPDLAESGSGTSLSDDHSSLASAASSSENMPAGSSEANHSDEGGDGEEATAASVGQKKRKRWVPEVDEATEISGEQLKRWIDDPSDLLGRPAATPMRSATSSGGLLNLQSTGLAAAGMSASLMSLLHSRKGRETKQGKTSAASSSIEESSSSRASIRRKRTRSQSPASSASSSCPSLCLLAAAASPRSGSSSVRSSRRRLEAPSSQAVDAGTPSFVHRLPLRKGDASDDTPWAFRPHVQTALKKFPLVIISPDFETSQRFNNSIKPHALKMANFHGYHKTSLAPVSASAPHFLERFSGEVPHCTETSPREVFSALETLLQGGKLTADQTQRFTNRPYTHNKPWSETEEGQQELSLREEDEDENEPRSSKRRRTSSCDQPAENKRGRFMDTLLRKECPKSLQMSEFYLHPQSLLRFSHDVTWQGGQTEYMFIKKGFASFNLHIEQEIHNFYHHQVFGHSVWVVIHPDHADDLAKLIAEPILKQYAKNHKHRITDADMKLLARLAMSAKTIFPPLSVLDEAKIRYEIVRVHAGDILIGRGDLAHCGFGVASGETIALACNLAAPDWIDRGVEHIKRHFEWVRDLCREGKESLKAKLDQHQKLLAVDLADVALAINHCPPNHSCSLLRGLRVALEQKEEPFKRVGKTKRAEWRKAIDETLDLLHEVQAYKQMPLLYLDYDPAWALCKTCGLMRVPRSESPEF
jgi:hypothetical protein